MREGLSTAEMQELGHEGTPSETQSAAEIQELEPEDKQRGPGDPGSEVGIWKHSLTDVQ